MAHALSGCVGPGVVTRFRPPGLVTCRGLTRGGAGKRNGRVGDPTRPFVVNGCSGRIEPGQCFTGSGRRACQRCRRGCSSGPDLLAFVAFEARSLQPVAAFEVTDPSLGAGSVTLQPSLGAFGTGLLAAGDEHPGSAAASCGSSATRTGSSTASTSASGSARTTGCACWW